MLALQHEVYIVISYFLFSSSQHPRGCSTEFNIWKNWLTLSFSLSNDIEFIFTNAALTNLDSDVKSPGNPIVPIPLLYSFKSSPLLNVFSLLLADKLLYLLSVNICLSNVGLLVRIPTGFSYIFIPSCTDSTVIASLLSAIIQCNCAAGNWLLNCVSVIFMFSICFLASSTVALWLNIHGMNSYCAMLVFPCWLLLYFAFPTKFNPAIPKPFSFIAS